MRFWKNIGLNLLIINGLAAAVSQAEAAVIVNISREPQTIEVETAGSYETVVIAPSGTWRDPGMHRVRYRGREITVDYDQEFAIWPNGDFGPQRTFRDHYHRFYH